MNPIEHLWDIIERWPSVGLSISGILLVSSWIVTWCISYYYKLSPLFVGISSATDYETYKDQLLLHWNLIYSKPYCRCGPYIIGMFLAYIMYRNKATHWDMKLWLKYIGWSCATFLSMSVIYGLYHIKHNEMLFHFYNALSRSAFGISLAWLIFCCLSGNAELVNKILASKMWIPASRLTYCAYLFHPLIMTWYFNSQMTPFYFTHTNMVSILIIPPGIPILTIISIDRCPGIHISTGAQIMLYFGFLVVSYIVAFFISITFETPIINIEKILIKKIS
ncbi:nose resistant to fluoxetine protein 6 [Caerostris darwini]|uniref:Nose resistant to fluoxetine protein 6 n=1 Tax=Caerostris darwini TaxID=1538125 RepID=A0AAV4TRI5_9ARAC|nr:nose resistant to fluoxetine protein 6 [Caerostris darwini]